MRLSQADRIRRVARLHGWRLRDPGDVAWSHQYQRYRKGPWDVYVRYDRRGAVHHADLYSTSGLTESVIPAQKFKASAVMNWFGTR
jgi:hypothetical protein